MEVIPKMACHLKYAFFCGKESHERDKCPASKSKYSGCEKIGHWRKVCKSSKSVRHIEQEKDFGKEDTEYFLGQIKVHSMIKEGRRKCNCEVERFDKPVQFLIDSGADVICIPDKLLPRSMQNEIEPSTEIISDPDGIYN
ncbi:unnamed protein product [Psylliodes chrysocephalus]|uniref:Uncharacterized protein n=1 Tax=Psylliodes chrysocephalus TaxID=3402493 RepID=A0A9P0D1K0_9CUCU|nr:unnamed protein product [Psylliodes chrysocephala]